MTSLARTVIVNALGGAAFGCVLAVGASLYGAGDPGGLLSSGDRLIGLAMLVATLAPAFATSFVGTALAASMPEPRPARRSPYPATRLPHVARSGG